MGAFHEKTKLEEKLRGKELGRQKKVKTLLDQRGTNQPRIFVELARKDMWLECRCVWRSRGWWRGCDLAAHRGSRQEDLSQS